MSKLLIIIPSAQAGADAAARDYELKSSGLGTRFVFAVKDSLNRIAANPLYFGLFRGRTRFAIVRKFPFLILFVNQRHRIVITSIVPSRSNPASWRLKP
jgi:hypothetical protein